MVHNRETQIYRQDVQARGAFLSPEGRERLLKPYLPAPPNKSSTPRRKVSQPIQDFIMKQIHLLIFSIIHMLFSIYIRIRQTHQAILDRILAILYYHHRAPELIKQDVRSLDRLPQHLSVILNLKGDDQGTASLEALIDDVAEISAWCCCVGLPTLSVYEKTGNQESRLTRIRIKVYRHSQELHTHNSPSDLKEDACVFRETCTVSPNWGTSYASVLERWEI